MGYTLLWIEDAAFWICFMALGVALAVRIKRSLVRGCVLLMFAAVPLFFLGALAAFVSLLESGARVSSGLLAPTVSLLTLVVLGIVTIGARGLRRDGAGQPRAADWALRPLALTTAALFLTHAMTFWNLDLAVRQQIDALRVEAGALATSVAPPAVPDRENAAYLYQQAFDGGLVGAKPAAHARWLEESMRRGQAMPAETRDPRDTMAAAGPLDPAHDAEFVAYVERNSEMCRLLRQAAERPACNFGRDWGRPSVSMLLEETQNLRAAARELQLEAHYAAAHGDLPRAFENLVAIHRISDHVGQEPLLVSLFVSFAVESLAVANLETLLQHYDVGAKDLDILDAWRPVPATPRLRRAMRMEEAVDVSTMCELAEWRNLQAPADVLGLQGWPPNASPFYRVFLLRGDVDGYQEFHRRWHGAFFLPAKQRQEALDRIDASLKSTPGGVVTRLVLPVLGQVATAASRTDAVQRLAQLAVASHRFRLARGRFPESIDELVQFSKSIYAHDPFSGELLKLVVRDGDVILYSVGPDLQDDGGRPQADHSKSYDLTFVLKTPPQQ